MTKPPRKPSQPLLRETEAPVRSRARRPRDPAQPRLPFDPMPDRIEPCLALLKAKPPRGPDWLFEVKWDGYRVAVHIRPNDVRIITRGGHDWTDRFPAIAAAARTIGVGMAILDGEAVVLDAQGRSDFGALVKEGDGPIRLFAGSRSRWRRAAGCGLRAWAGRHHAKHRDSAYRSGRLGDWLKIKCVQSDSFVIIGYEPSASARGGIGSLLLAAYRNDALVYVGSVGTGFKEREAVELRQMLDRLKTKRPSVAVDKKGVVFAQPTLIAKIEYRAWTDDGKLRHASYKGLRDVQDNAAIYRLGD